MRLMWLLELLTKYRRWNDGEINLKRLLKKQTKIKCLCSHEYLLCGTFGSNTKQYIFHCNKCGKEKCMDVYDRTVR